MYFNTSDFGTKKNAWANKITWCSLCDKIHSISAFGGRSNSKLAWLYNQHAANNPFIDSDTLTQSVALSVDRRFPNPLQVFHKGESVAERIEDALLSSLSFTRIDDVDERAKIQRNGTFFINNDEAALASSRLMIPEFLIASKNALWYVSEDYLVILRMDDVEAQVLSAGLHYHLLEHGRVWDGTPLVALEGFTYLPECYMTPAVRPVPDVSIATRELRRMQQ